MMHVVVCIGNGDKGITARSLNIKDIEYYMTPAKLAEAQGTGYQVQTSRAYTSNKNYPSIYAQEKLSVITTSSGITANGETGLGMSEQQEFVEKTDEGATDGKITTATSIQPYQTYWGKKNDYMQEAFRTAENGTNYYSLLINTTGNYWLASRCVNAYSGFCGFYMRRVYSGDVGANDMYHSNDYTNYNSRALFPVVSLSSELINRDEAGRFTVNLE